MSRTTTLTTASATTTFTTWTGAWDAARKTSGIAYIDQRCTDGSRRAFFVFQNGVAEFGHGEPLR
jgi:hypothetical protein